MSDQAIWIAIRDFDLDHPLSAYGFSTRLASENNWTKGFTEKAVLEYKKFMFLAGTCDQMVAPAPIVDIVWHQHLVFTRSYAELCRLIGKTIHHIPSTHSQSEQVRLEQARLYTQERYHEQFGEQAADIWQYSSMPDSLELKDSRRNLWSVTILISVLLLALSLPACILLRPLYLQIGNPAFITGYIFLTILLFALLEQYNRNYLNRIFHHLPENNFLQQLQAPEVIYLKTGKPSEVVHHIVNRLIRLGRIRICPDNDLKRADDIPATDAASCQVLEVLEHTRKTPYLRLVCQLPAKPAFRNIANTLNAFREHFIRSRVFHRLYRINFVILALWCLAGMLRMVIGLLRDKPVTYIAIINVILAMVAFFYLRRLTYLLCRQTIPAYYRNQVQDKLADAGDWQYFLWGNSALVASFLPIVSHSRYNENDGENSGSACGSGCSGGCGGCGGD